MATKNDDAVKQFLARAATGQQTTAEEAASLLKTEFNEDPKGFQAIAGSSSAVVDWEDPSTRQRREKLYAPADKVQAEADSLKSVNDDTVNVEPPQGSRSNDPAVNPGAVGGEPFADVSGVGFSGQVASPEDYRDDEPKAKAAAKK